MAAGPRGCTGAANAWIMVTGEVVLVAMVVSGPRTEPSGPTGSAHLTSAIRRDWLRPSASRRQT